ncbi:MAG: transposase [Victivallales bacterium]
MKRKPETTRFYRKRLPHWEVTEGLYFVTIRQAGTIPPGGIRRLKELSEELRSAPNVTETKRQKIIFAMLEKFLNTSTKGNLTEEPYQSIIKNAVRHRHETGKWRIIEYVIMPNHIHLFFQNNTIELAKIIRDFKRRTKTEFNYQAKNNPVKWQREWFDHWSRSADEDEKIIEYIRNNPVKAGFVKNYQDYPHGGW